MKKQFNVRISKTTEDYILFLTKKYGYKTQVVEVAVALLFTQFMNINDPGDPSMQECENCGGRKIFGVCQNASENEDCNV